MPVEISTDSGTARMAAPPSPPTRIIVDWHAGSPVYADDVAALPAIATRAPRSMAWLLKPGDIVCDWLKVKEEDSRALVRLYVNLTIYGKIAVAIAFLVS